MKPYPGLLDAFEEVVAKACFLPADGVLFRRGFAAALGLAATVFLLLMIWSDNPLDAHGLFERLATGALSVWMLVFATRMLRWLNPRQGPLERR